MTREISCSTFESRVNQLLDKRIDLKSDAPISRHVTDCASCKLILDDYLALDDSFNNVIFDSETLAKLEKGQIKPSRQGVWASLAIAAVVVLGFGIAFNLDSKIDHATTQVASVVNPESTSFENVTAAISTESAPKSLAMESVKPSDINSEVTKIPEMTPAVSWGSLAEQLGSLNPYYQISAEITGVRPIQSSLHVTLDWVQDTIREW